MRLRAYGLVLAAACLCGPVVARADNQAAAEALFRKAKALATDGKWAEACPKLAASFELDEQLGTLMNLADCREHIGKLATAWADWTRAVEWGRREGDPRLGWIEGREKQIEPRLPKLQVVVTRQDETLHVEQNGAAVPPASYGVAVAVDPGSVTLRVVRGTEVLDERQVKAEEGKTTQVELDLAAIGAAHPAAQPSATPTGSAPAPPAAAPPDRRASGAHDPTQRTIGLVVGGVGIAAVLAATGLEIAAVVKKGQADATDACVNKICSPQGLDAANAGATFAVVGQWLGIGGLAATAVGATIFLTAPSAPSTEARLRLVPWLSPGLTGVSVEGAL